MGDVTYEDYQDLVRKLSLANERVRDLQERVSGREACIASLEAQLAEARKALEWHPIETVPLNTIVDLWCTYADAPASWGNDCPAGHIVHNRHKSKEHGWFGNESNDGIPQANGPDLVPVAWRWPTPEIPLEMMERFVAARVRAEDNAKTLIDAVSEEVWSHDASQDNCNVIDKDGLT